LRRLISNTAAEVTVDAALAFWRENGAMRYAYCALRSRRSIRSIRSGLVARPCTGMRTGKPAPHRVRG